MSERIYAFDSSKTAIGPVEGWSPALRVMVRFLLANRFPLLLWWGPDIAYGPVPDESTPTGIGGVLGTVHEITEKVVSERRVAALRDLGAATIETRATPEEACRFAANALAKHEREIPFALVYLNTPDGKQAKLAGSAGVALRKKRYGSSKTTTSIACCSTPTCTVDRSTGLPRPLRVTACRLSLLPVMDGRICRFRSGKRGPWTSRSARGNCSRQSRNCCQQLVAWRS
jgi:hypothetical protein